MQNNLPTQAALSLADAAYGGGAMLPVPEHQPKGNLPRRNRDRRGAERLRTVFRIARVACGKAAGLWRVRNISDFGMMLHTHARVGEGERVSISLSEAITLDAKVVWCDGERCGVEFDTPVDSARILMELARERMAHRDRPPRLSVAIPAVGYCENGIHAIRVTDISQKGIGFTHDGCFTAGMKTLIKLEGGVERRGVVRWSADGHAGLLLLEPLSCAELERVTGDKAQETPAAASEAALLI